MSSKTTTIKSIYGSEWTFELFTGGAREFKGIPCVAITPEGECDRAFPLAEVLEALGATADAEAKLREAEKELRDLRAKIESVALHQEIWGSWAKKQGHKTLSAAEAFGSVASDLAIILDKPAPFTLPTNAGAGIVAKLGGVRYEFRLFTSGFWIADDGSEYGPQQVLADFTDHCLIEADQ